MSTKSRLWTYTIVLVVASACSYPALVGDYASPTSRELLAGLLVVVGVPVGELLVVHLHFRKSSHSFSLLEAPLVAGMLTTQPLLLVLAYAFGSGFVLAARRRQSPLKLLFNMATRVLTATLAVFLYRATSLSGDLGAWFTWAAAIGATLVGSGLGTVLVFGVISIAEGRLVWRDLGVSLTWGLATAAGAASLGVGCALLAQVSPLAIIFVTGPLLAVFLANRAYEGERQRRENLQLIFDTSRTLTDERESELAFVGALQRCFDSFPCDFAAAYLPQAGQGLLHLRVDQMGQHRSVGEAEGLQPLLDLAAARTRAWLITADGEPGSAGSQERAVLAAVMEGGERTEALVAPLVAGNESIGVVVVGNRGASFRRLGTGDISLIETVCQGIASHTLLARQAGEDALTNLPNRRRLMERLAEAHGAAAWDQTLLMLIDLDDFKGINDTFGHGAGDTVLVQVANRLTAAAGGWVVARLGGDEFAVVGIADHGDDWRQRAQMMLDSFNAPIFASSQEFNVRISIGAAVGASADGPTMLLRNADTALYEAKRMGKAQLMAFDESMHISAARQFLLASALRQALERDELTVVVQPIVRCSDGAVVGGEALSRWHHAELGEVRPDEFVAIAESNGLTPALSRAVIAKTIAILLRAPGALTVSLNLSPVDLNDPDVVADLLAGAVRVAPHTLGVEVTERTFVTDPAAYSVLARLRRAGITIYIDDFGTGYSSLAYLKDLPADYLKVPREFVKDLNTGTRSLAVVSAIVGIGEALGLGVSAEGVETEEQNAILRDLGVEVAQGYLFGRPVPVESFLESVRREALDNAA